MRLELIKADILNGISHGFFTRKGGASSGIFHGLNCGLSSSDQSDIVKINRARVAQEFDLASDQLCAVHQVHSAAVATISGVQTGALPEADALVTNQPGLILAILTADCQPVLFADREAGVIGAAHAGWRGAMSGVLEATVCAMENLGAKRENIHAAIGPCISQPAYEVGPEFLDTFTTSDARNECFFTKAAGDRYIFDLPAYGLNLLGQSGVDHVEWTRHCTYGDSDRFYSYRRSVHEKEADYGRLISAIHL